MEGLNDSEPRKITVKGPYTFSIGDVSGLGHTRVVVCTHQVKMPKFLDFQSLEEQLKKPEFLISDFAKFDRPSQLHVGFQAFTICRRARWRVTSTAQRRMRGGFEAPKVSPSSGDEKVELMRMLSRNSATRHMGISILWLPSLVV